MYPYMCTYANKQKKIQCVCPLSSLQVALSSGPPSLIEKEEGSRRQDHMRNCHIFNEHRQDALLQCCQC